MAQPKKNEEDKYIKMSLSFEPRQLERLLKFCQEEERSISWAIRKALDNYLPPEQE